MVGFTKRRVEYDDETKKMIYNEYMTTRKSIRALASKYNISDGTMMNIINKFRDEKKKENQFLTELGYSKEIQIKNPPPNKLSVDTSHKQYRQVSQTAKPIYKSSPSPQPEKYHVPMNNHTGNTLTITKKKVNRADMKGYVNALDDIVGKYKK